MEDYMIRYFSAEKHESIIFILAGITAVAVSIYLIKTDSSYKGMIYPLILIAVIQIVVGGTVFFRTDSQLADLKIQLKNNPEDYKKQEFARMSIVMKNFKIYKSIEILLLMAGILLTFVYQDKNLWYAIGLGLIVQSALMLILDLFAEKRGLDYMRRLSEFVF